MGIFCSCLKGANDQHFSRPSTRRTPNTPASDYLGKRSNLEEDVPSKILKSKTVDGQLQSVSAGETVTSEDVSNSSRISNSEKSDSGGKLKNEHEQKPEVKTFAGSSGTIMKQHPSCSIKRDVISFPTDSDDSLMEDILQRSLSDLNSKKIGEPSFLNDGINSHDGHPTSWKNQDKEGSQVDSNLMVQKKRIATQNSSSRKNTPVVEHILPVHTQVKNFEHIEAESKKIPSRHRENSLYEAHTSSSIEELVEYYQRLDREANIDSEVFVKNGQAPGIERKLGTRIALTAKNYGRMAEIE